MDLAYRLIIYILMANVAYMIFSLWLKGFRHYSGYISQLFFLLCLMIVIVARGFSGGVVIFVAIAGIFFLVFLPMMIQRKIDVLMSAGRFEELEFYARLKANIVWSELNVHLHRIAIVAKNHVQAPGQLEASLKQMLGKGEPYDGMTRLFLAQLHFNSRNFNSLINDLVVEGKSYSDYSFEELLYLVRAYLETARYEEAVAAQLALESKTAEDGQEAGSVERRSNLSISRLIFFAFMGWTQELERLIKSEATGVEALPEFLKEFWVGVALFNSGEFSEGEKKMSAVMAGLDKDNTDLMLPFMRKRFFGLIENKEFIKDKVLPELNELRGRRSQDFAQLEAVQKSAGNMLKFKERGTNFLIWTIMFVSVLIMYSRSIEDLVSLIEVGANSSFLVQQGEYFRLLTYQFVHIGWVHLLMNTVALKFFGPPVETLIGLPLYFGLFFFSGIIGGLAAVQAGQSLSAGASASVLGLLSAAIVFELLKVKGAERLKQRNNFSTLIFILVINLVIGVVESGIDNSAHVGGLLAGAVAALSISFVLKSRFVKTLAGYLSAAACLLLVAGSLWQMYELGSEFYPNSFGELVTMSNAPETIKLDLPDSWVMDQEQANLQSLAATGPFRESVNVIISFNNAPVEQVMEEYVLERTLEIEKTAEINLITCQGPTAYPLKSEHTYRVAWLLDTSGGSLSVVDYVIFEDQLLYFVRFYIGTQRYTAYNKLMDAAVKSLRVAGQN